MFFTPFRFCYRILKCYIPACCLLAYWIEGLSGPSSIEFSPKRINGQGNEKSEYLVFVSSTMKLPSPSTSSTAGATASTATATNASSSRRSRNQTVDSSTTISQSSNASEAPGLAAGSFRVTPATSNERQLCVLDLATFQSRPLLRLPSKRRNTSADGNDNTTQQRQSSSRSRQFSSSPSSSVSSSSSRPATTESLSLEERLRRERQRMHSSGGLTQFCWTYGSDDILRILVPIRGSLFIQDGLDSPLRVVYDKHYMDQVVKSSNMVPPPPTAAIDPQLSPDGKLFAFCVLGEIFVSPCHECRPPVQVTFGADLKNCITHGLAEFVAQEEMDRYRGFWWSLDSKGILFTRVDESQVPPYRITHHEYESTSADSCTFEDHRYPFAGKTNPTVRLAYVKIDQDSILGTYSSADDTRRNDHSGTPTMDTSYGTWERSSTDWDPQKIAQDNWASVRWFDPPREASEYLARLDFLPDGHACAQWQNRTQNCLVLVRMNLETGRGRTLLVERSDAWINLHHLLHVLDLPIHPNECGKYNFLPPLPDPLPHGSFSFIFGSERSGFCHLYLYTYVPGMNGDQAMLVRQISAGDWVVESIAGLSLKHNAVYVAGTYDSVLERHLYALPIIVQDQPQTSDNMAMDTSNSSGGQHPNGMRRGFKQVINALSGKSQVGSNGNGSSFDGSHSNKQRSGTSYAMHSYSSAMGSSPPAPLRLTQESGMHSIVMDPDCTKFVDTSSDLGRPTSVRIYEIPEDGPFASLSSEDSEYDHPTPALNISRGDFFRLRLLHTIYDAFQNDRTISAHSHDVLSTLAAPELLSFLSSDGTETLHAALYRPDAHIHGPGPYPLVCAVYGGPHVQRVNRSWSQCADMRAQRLRSLGFCVVKCDNRGSSRRGLAFESAIARRLGRLEVLDQVAVVRQLTVRGIADPTRVGIYGWSYGGYLAAMCLCRAPDVFQVAVAGAPVTSWDGYDTHYTERYMGLPSENPNGYRESAVFDHVPNMRGKLLLVHGLIDENVHFRHTARLINRLIAAGKDYDLLLFPDERHSPRRLRDRIYMEQRISDYFSKNLLYRSGSSYAVYGNSNATVRKVSGL